jgi:hypothetical protein
VPKKQTIPGTTGASDKGNGEATYYEVSPRESNEQKMPSVVERELIQIDHQWVCSQCAHLFLNPGCALDGLTLNEIIQHLQKKMRERAFADHVCPAQDF